MKVYLAAPLFSQVQRQYNRHLCKRLQDLLPRCEVVLPQDFRIGTRSAAFNDRRHLPAIYARCIESIAAADAVLALLDGADADSGVAYEVGYARALGKPVLGVRTDYRQLQFKGLNIMLAQGCTEVVCHFSFNERLDDLAAKIVERLETLAGGPAARRVRQP